MNHIPLFENYNPTTQLVDETYIILEGKVDHDELSDILNEGIFSFVRGLFINPIKKRKLSKLGEELFKSKVELQKIEIEEDQLDRFKQDLKAKSTDYTKTETKIDVADKAKATKIQALRDKEEIIISQMDAIGDENDVLGKFVAKVKLEIRMRANDATIKLADAEMTRVLRSLQRNDAKEVKNLDKELRKEL